MSDTFLYVARAEVEQACERIDVVGAVRDALTQHARRCSLLPNEAYLSWDTPGGGVARSIAMPGLVPGAPPIAGTKLINANPANVSRHTRRASGLTILFDAETARVRCVLEAAHLSAVRTAAVSSLAIELLGGGRVETLAVLGAGELAEAHIRMLLGRLPQPPDVRVFDAVPERVGSLRARLGIGRAGIETSTSAETAVREADVVIAVTTSTHPYIPLAWLRQGALVVNVSLDDVCQNVVLGADGLFVDDWNLVMADRRRLLGRMAASGLVVGPGEIPDRLGVRAIDGTLGDVITGTHPGRRGPEEIILVNPFGLAIEDLVVAHRVAHVAEAHGLGRRLPV